MDKSDIIKVNSLVLWKPLLRMKRWSTDWEKIIASYIFHLVFVPKIYKVLSKFLRKQLNWKMDNGLEQTLPKENMRMTVKHILKKIISLTTREMQIKAIVKDHHTLVRMTKLTILSFVWIWTNWISHVSGNAKWYSYSGEYLVGYFKDILSIWHNSFTTQGEIKTHVY